ncbi:MAG: DUF4430 domain-containing protein [Candidatus Kaiserbacteria bacterium]|nr:DUF4430 domain-containing protein [Candidatus Kaiserbacteria bacterium]
MKYGVRVSLGSLVLCFLLTGVAFADDATSTPDAATSTPIAPDTVTLTIRDGSNTAFSGTADLPATTSADASITPTSGGSAVSVPARSLLAVLSSLDSSSSAFDITDLSYFSSFNSFLINCIAVPSGATPDCFDWTYAVNGAFPQVGADHTTLNNGDVIYVFFGPQRKAVLASSTVESGTPFTVTAESYDLASGNYVPLPGVTLGVGTSNPDFSFTELATGVADQNGETILTVNATGTYQVGIKEDFYFPNTPLTVTDHASVATSTASSTPVGASSGSGGGIFKPVFNVAAALQFLASAQNADGSFADDRLTDWAALTFAAGDPGAAKTKLHSYIASASPALSSPTDFERHAMALEALGINPYTGGDKDYIAPIVAAFDGTKINGAPVNGDIFALFPLMHAGYSANDAVIQKLTAYIVAQQAANGSWMDPDTTSAGIQALSLVRSQPGVSDALNKASTYLHNQQKSDGGFSVDGTSFSTSWAAQAIAALGDGNWNVNGNGTGDALAAGQQSDGGMENTSGAQATRVWATEYAVPGALGRTWDSLLASFTQPAGGNSAPNSTTYAEASSTAASTITIATTTPIVATSTPVLATSTPPTATSTPVEVITIVPTTTAPAPKPHSIKPLVPKPTPKTPKETPPHTDPIATSTTQTASAAAGSGGLFGLIRSFFSWLINVIG